ncbi:DUF362 domain-containing protein [candidate division WOR-3 bacterium]|uniref:DUF362 domain-containing protein n=1 Tax=candidate division WOR-3 bacterium TaxID=2052148 RepID=A0A937XG38_UNCW3|nr:DUF362 domain-containing protein [candidate division WOR-3 bacterium]
MGNEMNRRDFLKTGIGIAAAALLPKALLGAVPGKDAGPVVAVARGNKAKLVGGALDLLGGMGRFVKPGDKVCIKPNFSFAANSECGATTSAEITRQVVQLCLAAGAARVVLFDYPIQEAALCIERSGMNSALVDKEKVSLLALSKERQFADTTIPSGKELKSARVAKVVLESDKFINLPTAKSHSATGVSLGMKGLMGLIWDRGALHQMNLHQAIADLASLVKPDLTIIDATRALTSGGPGGPGKTVALDMVIAGTDPVAVDSYAVGITQWYNKSFAGKSVKHIVAAAEMGLGEIDTAKMDIKQATV